MGILFEVPIGSGGAVLVEADPGELPARLMLENVESGHPVARSPVTWERLMEDLSDLLRPLGAALSAKPENLEVSAEVGLRIGGRDGLVLVSPGIGLFKLTIKASAVPATDATPSVGVGRGTSPAHRHD